MGINPIDVELTEALTLDCWTKDWTIELLFKTWLFKLQHFTSTDTWLVYTDTNAPPHAWFLHGTLDFQQSVLLIDYHSVVALHNQLFDVNFP